MKRIREPILFRVQIMTSGPLNWKPLTACGGRRAAGVRYDGEASLLVGSGDGLGILSKMRLLAVRTLIFPPKPAFYQQLNSHKYNLLVLENKA